MHSEAYVKRVKTSCEKDILKRKGVTGIGVGCKIQDGQRSEELCVRVYVAKKLPKSKLSKSELIPETIDGVPTDVIERTFVAHPKTVIERRAKVVEISAMVDAGNYATLKGGMSIGPCRAIDGYVYAGTLGCMVKDNQSNEMMALSNMHVMCVDNGWSVGDDLCQPSRVDSGTCPADVALKVERSSFGGKVDCAVAKLTGRPAECKVLEIGSVWGTAAANLNESVRKRGRTTELTHGFVDDLSWSGNIDMGDLGVVFFSDQIGILADASQNAAFGISGDSGSVVMNQSGRVIGLYFAGDTTGEFGLANRIDEVLTALDVSMCTSSLSIPPTIPTTPTTDIITTATADRHDITTRWADEHTSPVRDLLGTFPPDADRGGGGFSWNKHYDDVKAYGYDTLYEHLDYELPVDFGAPPWGRPGDRRSAGGGRSPFALATPHHAPNLPPQHAGQSPTSGATPASLEDQLQELTQMLAYCQSAIADLARSRGRER